MNKQDLEKSIVLVGPLSVGKSLIAPVLAEKIGYKYICIDDLMAFISGELNGLISPNQKEQKALIRVLLNEDYKDPDKIESMKDPKFIKNQTLLYENYIDIYNSVREAVGNLKKFYSIFSKIESFTYFIKSTEDEMAGMSMYISEILDIIIKSAKYPLVLDIPGWMGWNTNSLRISSDFSKILKEDKIEIDEKKCKKILNKIFNTATTVFLQPGMDYKIRNAANKEPVNQFLLNSLDGYFEHAKLMVSVNGLFYEPENKALHLRTWFDVKENLERDRIKNHSEINSIVEQIIDGVKELEEGKNLNIQT